MTILDDLPTGYVNRGDQERAISDQVEKVRLDGTSRALLLYGPGGSGKTTLVRMMAQQDRDAPGSVTWLPPIDVDDSEYWLLSNLETTVAESLDPGGTFFAEYFGYLGGLPRAAADQQIGYESVTARLGRINDAFVDCYRRFIESSGRTIVLTLDTVEAIRSTYLLLTLTQWMKTLPSTLFVLAGRPLSRREHHDPIRMELEDPHHPLDHVTITLRGFDATESGLYLGSSVLGDALTPQECTRLTELTDGQPLWLALAVEFLQQHDRPPEMTAPGPVGPSDVERFRTRLVSLYLSNDFWPEAIKRLAVVRHSVNEDVFERLMADIGLPPEIASWREAWTMLLARPWIRPRANRRYVTLHDALAEAIVQRLLPFDDLEETWQQEQWVRAREIYRELTTDQALGVDQEVARIGSALQSQDDSGRPALLRRVVAADATKRELDQLLTARLHYEILVDFQSGTALFLDLYDRAYQTRDVLFMELVCHEVERFLPRGETSEPLESVLGVSLQRFTEWLGSKPEHYVEIALRIGSFLIGTEQAESAFTLFEALPDDTSIAPDLRYRLANERGNACMRIADRVATAERYFWQALDEAQEFPEPQKLLREAEAHKELGFYFRNLGRWPEADNAYRQARDRLSTMMGPGSSDAAREEMASIQTQWAYLKALRGSYREARNLVDSAIAVRRRLNQRLGEAMSLSVSGEVHRYEGKFTRAWAAYTAAESIFHELKSWPWLGQLYQEQAICLHQAEREGIRVVDDQAKLRQTVIQQSLDICRESAIRCYPSALNRAGRIFAVTHDAAAGIETLDEGIREAQRIGDGWFYSANLIEYLELNYRTFRDTGDLRFRQAIDTREADVTRAIQTYGFPDLSSRWELLQGHLTVLSTIDAVDDPALYDRAADHYANGFRGLADERVGSHGSAAIAREFDHFRRLFDLLPPLVQKDWYKKLLDAWSEGSSAEPSTSLLARLEELY